MTVPFWNTRAELAERKLQAQLAGQFAPLHKTAMGLALGITLALALLIFTLVSVVADRERRFPLHLLSEFLFGYSVSYGGALIGALWAFVYGFASGWLLASARNFVIDFWLMKARIRADATATQDFLDKI